MDNKIKLNTIQCVSVPRSGHHLLIDMITKYYKSQNIPFKYCEYYTCCKHRPCKKNANIQKSHDLNIINNNRETVINIADCKIPVLIQFRNPLYNITSDYYLHCKNVKNTYENWLKFSKIQIIYIKNFLNKWVLSNKNKENIIFVSYESLLKDTYSILTRIIKIISPNHNIDIDILKSITKIIHRSRTLDTFEYYNKQYFNELYNIVKETYEKSQTIEKLILKKS